MTSQRCSGFSPSGTLAISFGLSQRCIHHRLVPIQFSATPLTPRSTTKRSRRVGVTILSSVKKIKGTDQNRVVIIKSSTLTSPVRMGIANSPGLGTGLCTVAVPAFVTTCIDRAYANGLCPNCPESSRAKGGLQYFMQGPGGGGKFLAGTEHDTHSALDTGITQRQATGAEFVHLCTAECRHGADSETAGDHAAYGGQLMTLESDRQFDLLVGECLLQQNAYHGGALQGDEVML